MMGQVIGIDIGGTNLRLGCVSADGQLEHFERKSSAPMLKERWMSCAGKSWTIWNGIP